MTSKAVNAYRIVIVDKSVEFRRATVIIARGVEGGWGGCRGAQNDRSEGDDNLIQFDDDLRLSLCRQKRQKNEGCVRCSHIY